MIDHRSFLLGTTAPFRPARHLPAMCGPLLVSDVVECLADGEYFRRRLKPLEPWAVREFVDVIARQFDAPGRAVLVSADQRRFLGTGLVPMRKVTLAEVGEVYP